MMGTGIERLDELLGGGLDPGSATLAVGPSFSGKTVLAYQFLLEGLAMEQPGILILTDRSASKARDTLEALMPHVAEYEKEDLLRFVDAYSRSVGAVEELPNAEYVESPMNLNALTAAIRAAQRGLVRDHPAHRIVLDSASTLITYTNANTTFRFLQVLLGKVGKAGGTTLVLLEADMHDPSEVRTIEHLVDGVIELSEDGDVQRLRVAGFPGADAGWVPYETEGTRFEIRGSSTEGQIH